MAKLKVFTVAVPFAGHVVTSITMPEDTTDEELFLALTEEGGQLSECYFDIHEPDQGDGEPLVEDLEVFWLSTLHDDYLPELYSLAPEAPPTLRLLAAVEEEEE